MDWIRENKTIASIMGVFLLAAAGLGFLVVKSWSTLGQSRENFDRLNNNLATMKSASLFPSQENLDKKKQAVGDYEQKVNTLSTVLLNLQPPIEPTTETEFQSKLKTLIGEVRSLAGSTTKLPAEFTLGFPEYTASLPKSAAVATELSDYLNASDAIIRSFIDAAVDSVDSYNRTELAAEKGQPAPPPQPVAAKGKAKKSKGGAEAPREVAKAVERRTITTTITCDQGSFQKVLNNLASPSQMPFFTAVRLLRVENEKNEGPLVSAVNLELQKQTPPPTEAGTAETAVQIGADGQPIAAAETSNVIQAAKPANKDAIGVLGQEKLKVYLEIDVIRFIDPATTPVAEAGAGN